MKDKVKSGKHRTVIAITKGKDISQAPEMQELKALYYNISNEEKARTIKHLKDTNNIVGEDVNKLI